LYPSLPPPRLPPFPTRRSSDLPAARGGPQLAGLVRAMARPRIRPSQRGASAPLSRARRMDAEGSGAEGGAMKGFLALEDGSVFAGESVGADGFAFGEAVFTTAMTGDQEIVTDPSFAERIVTFTAPMVGNYGIEPARSEAARPHARAVVMREARGPVWTDWLLEHGLVALSGVDTRTLTVHLRSRGAMRAIAVAGEGSVDEALRIVAEQPPMAGRPLAAEVSTPEPYVFADPARARVAVVDYGCKRLSQNHGVAASASPGKEVTPGSIDDAAVEGLDLPCRRAGWVEFHPEAGPGPHDAWPLPDQWVAEVAYAQAA